MNLDLLLMPEALVVVAAVRHKMVKLDIKMAIHLILITIIFILLLMCGKCEIMI